MLQKKYLDCLIAGGQGLRGCEKDCGQFNMMAGAKFKMNSWATLTFLV